MNNLSLNFFTSTRQHYNCPDIYKFTLSDLFKKSKIFTSCFKIAHIKILPDEEAKGAEIEDILKNEFNFNVILKTIGNWANNESHHAAYLQDIKTLFSHPELQNIKYGYFLENDWIIHKDDFDPYIMDAISILEYAPELLTFRYTRIDETDKIQRLNAKLLDGYNSIYVQSQEFSFNPTFLRNRDMRFISQFAHKNHLNINLHCERAFGLAANYLLSDNIGMGYYDDRFAFIDNRIVEHIGCPDAIKRLKL